MQSEVGMHSDGLWKRTQRQIPVLIPFHLETSMVGTQLDLKPKPVSGMDLGIFR